tara:strand:- start:227 stop:1426 length:1200 start_codon:yes stop_codon:yes gene_type:complete
MIQKPLSCRIKKSDVQLDYENVIIKYTDGYESEIKKMISIIYDEIGDIWDEMWTWDDVVDRFEKGHFLWLVFDEGSPIACSWFEKKSKEDLYIYNTYLKPELRGKGLTKTLLLVRNNLFYDSGFRKTLCVTDNIRAERGLKKIGYKNDNWLGYTYTFWTGGYDSTWLICKLLLDGKIVQPIYIDDRVDHGGYHSNPLIKQRGEDTYPRRSTEIELERQSWLREKIYDTIPNSKELLKETSIISYPITEHDGVSKLVEKYNEWIPEPIYKDKDGEPHWLEVQADLLARFQKEFGLEIYLSHENILEGEVWEIMDDYIEDGKLMVDKLPEEHKEWEVFAGFNHALRRTNKYEMLNEAKKLGFDDLLYYTWTCWWPVDDKPCNKCKLCKQRIIECRSLGDTT